MNAAADGAPAARGFRFVLEYDGADFEGWQIQSGPRPARTVQAVLDEALAPLAAPGTPAPRVRGAGRTDAGVHAEGQVASATFATRLAPEALRRALNGRLPADCVVRRLDSVPPDWDALREARGKHYRYRVWNGPERSPLRAGRFYQSAEPLDLEAMRAASARLVGEHDFAAFAAAGSSVSTTVRRLTALEWRGTSGGELQLEARGAGFLRHMVRNLAGTLLEVGRGRFRPEQMKSILASRDRGQAGPTAPAHGLCLVAVEDSFTAGEVASEGLASVDENAPVG